LECLADGKYLYDWGSWLGLFLLVAYFVKAASVRSDLLSKLSKKVDLLNKVSQMVMSGFVAIRLSHSVCTYLFIIIIIIIN
jgi:hypothetical protein